MRCARSPSAWAASSASRSSRSPGSGSSPSGGSHRAAGSRAGSCSRARSCSSTRRAATRAGTARPGRRCSTPPTRRAPARTSGSASAPSSRGSPSCRTSCRTGRRARCAPAGSCRCSRGRRRSRSLLRTSSSTASCSRNCSPHARAPHDAPRLRRRRLDLPRRDLRRDHEPQPRPARALPDGHAVVDLRAPAHDRLPREGGPADLQGDEAACGRPGRAVAHAHGHRRQRDGDRADPGARDRRPQEGREHRPRRAAGAQGMSQLLPLPAAIPLLTAAVVVATDHVVPRRVQNAIALAATAASAAIALVVLAQTERHGTVHWFGGWTPRHGVALGIAFVAEPLGAGMAALALVLATLSLAYSWTSMREAARLYNTLVLLFAGAMAGFALSGDVFNMFVWFELMGVAAYALCGFKVAELGPLQGGISFAITNTLGAYFIVMGIALLYARTGALNLAQIGATLAGHRMDGLALVAFLLLLVGFAVKAAIVPFHFWLADAHAVAPAPVCVLFSGVMVELGIYAVARIFWTVFAGVLGEFEHPIRDVLLGVGAVTAILGALMCGLHRHVKRLLAYSTIAHAGCFLMGVALLTPDALAGSAVYVLAHGLAKGALFLVGGILL